jgi:hypothetical protein
MSSIPLIFLACKYTEPHTFQIQRNIWNASIYAQEVALLGAVPLCPATIGSNYEGIQDYLWWGEAYMTLMRRCDAVFMVPGYDRSNGATKEEVEALRLGMPVFYTLEDLNDWMSNQSPAPVTLPSFQTENP